ncbi:MAG TPA: YkgJ family cysteine cluster protein [Sphingomicrobium sp.]|nr:YkgJ family cysteine cluster protein [Sphingomicrobium sp.]
MHCGVRRFACTACGKCCNRSPEVELSEAAALADVFVFRLMFRLYSLPRTFESSRSPYENAETFYQKKRLLAAHAARKYPQKIMQDGHRVERTQYLMISALALDTRSGACAALSDGRCGIYDRRPLGCRTVPFHYSRADALAERDLDAFVATPGYACDAGEGAPVVVESGRIVDRLTLQTREEALALARRDLPWKQAIVRRMKASLSAESPLPSLDEVKANAAFGAMTTSMRVGWEIAAEAGLISTNECKALIAAQAILIEREFVAGKCPKDAHETLADMRGEYASHIGDGWLTGTPFSGAAPLMSA